MFIPVDIFPIVIGEDPEFGTFTGTMESPRIASIGFAKIFFHVDISKISPHK